MKRNLLKFLLLTAIICLPIFAQNVYACQCFGIPTPYKAFTEAKAVFAGKVISVTDSSGKEVIKKKAADPDDLDARFEREEGERYYRFAVREWFKGTKESEVIVAHYSNMCQIGFNVGDEFLVYAYESGGILRTSTFCYRTTDLESAQQDEIHFLRELLKGLPEPRIYGTVQLNDKDPMTDSYRSKLLGGIKIIAQRDKRRYVTFTDKNGLYRFKQLPDGKYRVYPDVPKKYRDVFSYDDYEEINLQPNSIPYQTRYFKFNGTNAYSNLHLEWNNQISGKVLDAEGKYLEKASVRIIPLNRINKINDTPFLENRRAAEYLPWGNEKSNIRKYAMNGLTPGKYILAVEVFAPLASGKEKLRLYYPQAATPQTAEILNIGEFDTRNIDIKLPPEYTVREFEGAFTWYSGDFVKDGTVSIEKKENSDDPDNIIYDSQPVKDGKFKFQVFENGEYWLHATIYDEKAKPVKIRIGKSNPPIKITLPPLAGRSSEK